MLFSIGLAVFIGFVLPPDQGTWEVVRSSDGDFAFSMPACPLLSVQDAPAPSGLGKTLRYSCQVEKSTYLVERIESAEATAPDRVIERLVALEKGYFKEAQSVKEIKLVVDGIRGMTLRTRLPHRTAMAM